MVNWAMPQQTEPQPGGVIPISGGEDVALNYSMRPNTTAMFLSGDTSEMFIRGTDANGMTTVFRAFDINEKLPKTQQQMMGNSGNFATREEIDNIAKDLKEIKELLDGLTAPTPKG